MTSQTDFSSVYAIVCGVADRNGDAPSPIFIAALEIVTGADSQIGMPKLARQRTPPYPTGPQALLITVQAEDLACIHLALGWRLPERVIDLGVEFRNVANGRAVPGGPGLVGAMIWFGLPSTAAIRAGSSPSHIRRRLKVLAALFQRMKPQLDWGRALLRGRYLMAVGLMETTGAPVDKEVLQRLTRCWSAVRSALIAAVDADLRCYRNGHFQSGAFEAWLDQRGIDWPRTVRGTLDLADEVFKERVRLHPELGPLHDLRKTLALFDPESLTIGGDGRNRMPLRPFASRPGRNQPSAKASVLGGPKWSRFLIRPEPGTGLAWIDWAQQEFGIAAALSGDSNMQAAYEAGDPYLAFAIAVGAAPEGATSETHANVREQFKACALGVQNGMGGGTLARILSIPQPDAEALLHLHKQTFRQFWWWSEAVEHRALLEGRIQSVFGWQVRVTPESNPLFIRNFPMQANGAEMLRLACCMVTEAGIRVCAPLHDALLIEAKLDDLEATVAETQRLMADASAVVLDGVALRSEVRCVRYPERLGDSHGQGIWRIVEGLIGEGKA